MSRTNLYPNTVEIESGKVAVMCGVYMTTKDRPVDFKGWSTGTKAMYGFQPLFSTPIRIKEVKEIGKNLVDYYVPARAFASDGDLRVITLTKEEYEEYLKIAEPA